MTSRSVSKLALAVLAASSLALPAFSQAVDRARSRTEVTWAISVTNKGISTIPTFTLGKPAASVDASIRRGGFGVNPQFRVRLDGTPWSFLVWGRYRLLDRERPRVRVGAHPALAFRSATVSVNGVAREVMVAQHFAAGELSPSYSLSRNVSVGTYYLYRHGLDADVTRHTQFVAARAGVANLGLPARFVARLHPQVCYLRMDDWDGIYLNSRVPLAKRDLPAQLRALYRRAPNVALNSCCDMPSNSRASVRASPPPNAARAANGDSSGSARENFAFHGQTSLDIWAV
jgi:hypothetical protein